MVRLRGNPAEKPLFWIGSSLKDLKKLPAEVQDDLGAALSVAQFGGTHPAAKPWKGSGSGVLEIVESFDGNAYRAIYTVRFKDAVYVLHAFQKKSTKGLETPQVDVDLVNKRLGDARLHNEAHAKKDVP
jgi:phage-related protein